MLMHPIRFLLHLLRIISFWAKCWVKHMIFNSEAFENVKLSVHEQEYMLRLNAQRQRLRPRQDHGLRPMMLVTQIAVILTSDALKLLVQYVCSRSVKETTSLG